MNSLRADVLILGAGPAGATAALNLAGRRRVLLVDREPAPAPRIGESLPPAAARLLGDMGLLDEFLRQGHARYQGNRALWNGVAAEYHFLHDPDGPGWHLARGEFDAWLRATARRRGAALATPATVEDMTAAESGGWTVRLRTANGPCSATAAIVIDASGRGAALARRAGAVRQRHDQLVCGWLYGSDDTTDARGYSQVEACEEGWWYSAPLPERRRVLAFHTDADLVPRGGLRDAAELLAAAARLPALGALLARAGFTADATARATAAHSATLDVAAGPGWFAAGDAAIGFDPLSSQGIFNALYTGLAAAEAADRALDGDQTAHRMYNEELGAIGDAYRRHLVFWYSQERRWPHAPFWRRRQASV